MLEQKFFRCLSERLRHENNLSDITWALCEASPFFKKIFLEHCFGKVVPENLILQREYTRGKSRPDFFGKDLAENEYLLEVKIWDGNYHFDQYEKAFPKVKNKAFIANYVVPREYKPQNWHITSWKGFAETLEKALEQVPANEKAIIGGYLEYLKTVTEFKELKPMDLTKTSSLPDFYNILERVWTKCPGFEGTLVEGNSAKINALSFNRHIRYKKSKSQEVDLWYCLWLPEPCVCISFEKGCSIDFKTGEYAECIEYESEDTVLYLKETHFKKLCDNSLSVAEQEAILAGFLGEVLHMVK